jgi:hypothetical protein
MVLVLLQEIELQTIITNRMAVTQVMYVAGRMPLELAAKWSPYRLYAAAGNSTRVLAITFSFVAGFVRSNPIPGPNRFRRGGSPGPSKSPGPGSE